MAMARANAKYRQISKEYTRIISAFASDPTSKHRAVTKVVKTILLNAPYLLKGRYWEVKAKSLGAGVYELSMELKNG
jgi:hypothetical protein